MVWVWSVVLVVAVAGCGRLDFDPLDGDANPAGRTCWPWTTATTFTAPVRVAELATSGDDQQPHLSGDGLTIYYANDKAGNYDIYVADRPDRSSPFANVRRLDEVDSANDDVSFAPRDDDLEAYVSSSNGRPTADLWVSQRSSRTQPWGAPVRLAASSTQFFDYDPLPSPDGLRLYWAIENWPPGMGKTDIVFTSRGSTAGTFGPPVPVPGVNSSAVDDNPSLSPDELQIVFSSERAGTGDIYVATRTSIGDAFGTPVSLNGINDPTASDSEPFVTADGCELWFASNRRAATDSDIYMASVVR
jgi:Tol biopolymer transport system component